MRQLTAIENETIKRLEFAERRDAVKGGTGHRSTNDVADYHGITLQEADTMLNALVELGMVNAFEDDGEDLWKIAQ